MSKVKLGDVAELITKGTTPSSIGGAYTESGINFVKSESIANSKHLNAAIFEKIDEETDKKLKRSRLKKDDLLFSIAGAYLGKVAIVRDSDVPANTNQAVGIVRLKHDRVDKDYAYYFYSQKHITAYINNLSSQSSQPNLNLDLLGRLPFELKALEEQKKIAAVLSTLDAKIACNNRINAELEAMAKTLYDYWFVQFDFPDPNWKPYKSSGGKMVYNTTLKREIPVGWKADPLIESCQITDCLHSKKSKYFFESEDAYLLQLENIVDNGQIDLSKKYFVSKADYKMWTSRIELKQHDIVMTNAGRVAAFAQIPANVICGIGRNITAIRPHDIHPNFFFLSLSGLHIQSQILANLDQGAFFKSFNVKGIKLLNLLRPHPDLESAFEEKVAAVINKRHVLVAENAELAKLRDWLLPMLMNGQVTVA